MYIYTYTHTHTQHTHTHTHTHTQHFSMLLENLDKKKAKNNYSSERAACVAITAYDK